MDIETCQLLICLDYRPKQSLILKIKSLVEPFQTMEYNKTNHLELHQNMFQIFHNYSRIQCDSNNLIIIIKHLVRAVKAVLVLKSVELCQNIYSQHLFLTYPPTSLVYINVLLHTERDGVCTPGLSTQPPPQ